MKTHSNSRIVWQLAWRNLWRHKTRSWLTLSAIAITTLLLVFMLSFQFGTYATMKEQNLSLLSGFAQVQNPKFKEQPNLDHGFKIPAKWPQILQQQSGITAFGFRAQSFAILSNLADTRNRAVQVIGMQPEKEKHLSSLSQKVTLGNYFSDPNIKSPIVLGKQLADYLGLKIGDQLQLLGQDAYGSIAVDLFTLVGTFDLKVPELNQSLTQIRLSDFQQLFSYQDKAQQLVLKSENLDQMTQISPQLFAKLQQSNYPEKLVWRDWKNLQPALYQAIQMDMASAFLWYSALLLIVILIIINTLYMSLLERHNEFALLHALGLQPRQISLMLSGETLFLIMLGLLFGWIGGVAVSYYFIEVGINLPGMEETYAQFGLSGTLYPQLSTLSMGFVPAVFAAAWLLISIIIFVKLSGIRPLTGRQL